MQNNAYVVVIENAGNNYSAYSPDVPGCITTGDTPEETFENFKEALDLHFEALRDEGWAIPQPSATVRYLENAA